MRPHPSLHALRSQPEDLVVDAVTYLVRQYGWFDAKSMVATDAAVLGDAADAVLVRWALGAAWSDHASLCETWQRVHQQKNMPGLTYSREAAIAIDMQPCTRPQVLREEEAKVAAEEAARLAAEEADAAEEAAPAVARTFDAPRAAAPAPKAAAPAPKATGPVAALIDAIARSPISLTLDASAKGLNEVAGMVSGVAQVQGTYANIPACL